MPGSTEVNWKQLVFTASLTCIFTIVAGYATYTLTNKTSRLSYTIIEGPPFPDEDGFRSIVVLNVKNTGKRELEDIACSIFLATGRIQDGRLRISKSLAATETIKPNEYKINLPSLNPQETFSASVIITTPNEQDAPEVTVRAKGVVGEKQDQGKDSSSPAKDFALPLLVGSLAAMIAVIASVNTKLQRGFGKFVFPIGRSIFEPRGPGPFRRNEIIARILAQAGLHEEADRIRFSPSEMSYAGSSDYIVGVALKDSNKKNRSLAVLKALLLIDNMYYGSKDLNIANIKLLEGDSFDEEKIKRILGTTFDSDSAMIELREATDKLIDEMNPVRSNQTRD